MNNEPVAYRHWMIDEEFPEDSCWEYFDAPTGEDCKECIPLYAHPVKEPMMVLDGNRVYPAFKELTDGEILQQALFSFGNESENFDDSYWIGFAKAILRKAQEK